MSRLDGDAVYGERLYDLFDEGRDYATDAAPLRAVAMAHRPTTMTWLDVACGTGRHLAGLRTLVQGRRGGHQREAALRPQSQSRRRVPSTGARSELQA